MNHPGFDLDAAGNCRCGCGFNSDADHYERVTRGEDVYGFVPELADEQPSEIEARYLRAP